jgi:hypothetical protein
MIQLDEYKNNFLIYHTNYTILLNDLDRKEEKVRVKTDCLIFLKIS